MDYEEIRYTIRLDKELMRKFRYVAQYDGRSVNREIIHLMLLKVKDFEKKEGPITDSV